MKKGKSSFWGILAIFGLVINLAVGYRVYSNDEAVDAESEALEKMMIMMQIMHLIRQDYVNADRTEYKSLINGAVHGMVSRLDPHSSYLEPEDYISMIENTEGQFGGIGITVTMRDGILTIISPIEGTPGSRAGLRAGDHIIKIDGQTTQDMLLQDSVRRMKGEPGTEVNLTILRPADNETIEVVITRDIIEVPSVKDTRVLAENIGYVRVTQFDENAADRLTAALQVLMDQDIKSLILDLRNNPGGLLNIAVDMCGLFVPPNTLVVSTEGRRPSQNAAFRTKEGDILFTGPVAVLINGGSASAAEIVAGCLKDHRRAVLIGEKSFGKGSVQNVIALTDGSALRLTTAMYYTPKRLIIHENGITPDIVVELDHDTVEQLHAARAEALSTGTEFDQLRDPQVMRAFETMQSYSRYQHTMIPADNEGLSGTGNP